MHDSGFRKKQPIIRMVWIGLLLLAICLVICVTQVTILRSTYREEISDDFNTHTLASAQLLGNVLADITALNSNMADAVSDVGKVDYQIHGVLKTNSSITTVTRTVYIGNDGTEVFVDEQFTDVEADEYREILVPYVEAGDKTNVFIVCPDGVTRLFVIAPVYEDYEKIGAVCSVINLDVVVNGEAFHLIRSIGNCYIVSRDQTVQFANEKVAIDFGKDMDFTYGMLGTSDGKDVSKGVVNTIKSNMSKGLSGYDTITSNTGDSILISYQKISGIDDTYFVCCFRDNLVDDKIQPLLFRSVLSNIGIIFVMIMIILYVWASAKKANNTIEKLAYEDPVTKGKNINYFKDFVHSVMSVFKETPFVIYRFDIQNFRYINEAYGHLRADSVLQSCIANFTQIFSDKELCVRMNADQFLAILVNDHSLEQKLKEFENKVNEDAKSKGIKYPIKFKIGIYQIKKHDHDLDVMIDHANAARKMVNVDDKKMRATYTDEIVNKMRKVDRIESDMQRALATGEFKIFYQAKWDVVSDHVAGAEALARWIKADGSMVYPDEFIPIFEKNGFIEKLDFYVLESVCEQMKKVLDEGKAIYPVSVNQSRVLLHNPDYVDNIEKIIKRYDIPEGALELEITETVFDDDRDNMIETISKLKKFGVKVAMDDFGSGYSSLNMLKDAAFDIIKIDREFFSESVTSDVSMWILQKIIEMVSGLGMEVICEGVETEDQVKLLRALGCRMVQGYYYSKPIPYEDYKEKYI